MRLVLNIIAFLSLLAHAQSLRFLTSPIKVQKYHRNLALFQSKTSLETFVDKNFEADWRACKRKLPDLNDIWPYSIEYDEEDYDKLNDLLDTLNDNDQFDVKIICGDRSSKPILSHSSILSESSPVFKRFLSDQKPEGDFAVIELPDVDKVHCEELLSFIYTREFTDDSDLLRTDGEDLLRAALKYKITDLVEFFDNVLAEQVDDDNAVPLRFLAKKFDLEELKEACDDYLDNDIDLVRQELMEYVRRGIAAGEEDQKAEGQLAKPAALKENVKGDVDEGEQEEEEDVNNEVDYDYDSDE